MIGIKYRPLTLLDTTAFSWVAKIHKGYSTLQEGYDELLTEAELAQFITDNQANYTQYKIEQALISAQAEGASKFKSVRDKWQDIADRFAASNVGASITTAEAVTLADNFQEVEKYLRLNVPMKALAEIDLVPTDASFLTVEKRTLMKAELLAHIQEVFNV